MDATPLLELLRRHSGFEGCIEVYRRWLRLNLPLLVSGHRTTWSNYQAGKQFLVSQYPESTTSLMPDARNFFELPEGSRERESICTVLGIDPSFLVQLEYEGLLQPPEGVPPVYSLSGQKNIYWACFFQKEAGVTQEGIQALLPFLDFVESRDRAFRDLLHDIGTPLHVIGGRAGLMRRKLSGSEIAEKNLTIIQGQTENIVGLLQNYYEQEESYFSESES